MKTASDITDSVFMDVTLGRRTGYPDMAAFVAEDMPEVEAVLWRNLRAGTPTILVHANGMEILFTPAPPRLLDRALRRHRVRVEIRWRTQGHDYGVRTRLGSHPLTEMRRIVAA